METEVAVPAHPALAEKTHRQLMQMRICDLGVTLDASGLDRYIKQLYDELDRRDIPFHPPCYLTDEWGCPDGVPVIGIPFYLADPVLVALERETMLGAEGDDPAEMMKLLRHECGHAVNYAYHVHKRREWERLFGPFDSPYPEHYRTRRFSKRYVRHLEGSYAQRHPDEDFAETFAVWLSPVGDWRKRYKGWGAYDKLVFVDQAMHAIAGRVPQNGKSERDRPVESILQTLEEYYAAKRAKSKADFPDAYDEQLRGVFSRKRVPGAVAAAAWLRLRRHEMIDRVTRWTGERRYVVDQLYAHVTARARTLRLWIRPIDQSEIAADLSAFLASLVMNYFYSGSFLTEP